MILVTIETVLTLVILIGMGILMAHLGWYKKEDKEFLSKLIVNISIPALTVYTFFSDFPIEILKGSAKLLLVVSLGMVVAAWVGAFIGKRLGLDPVRQEGFIGSASLSNAIFIGLPVSESIFGPRAVPYVMLYYLANTVFTWGIFAPRLKAVGGKFGEEKLSRPRALVRDLLSPPLLALILSIVFAALGLRLPRMVLKTCSYLGNLSTPLSLMFIGGVVYETGIKNLSLDLTMVMLAFVRFIVSPLAVFLLGRVLGLDPFENQLMTLMAGMPVIAQLGVISDSYTEDSEFIMAGISITTLLSLFFIPVYIKVMEIFL